MHTGSSATHPRGRRSQYGEMQLAITKAFKRYHLFGFTGTPIFAEKAGTSGTPTRWSATSQSSRIRTATSSSSRALPL